MLTRIIEVLKILHQLTTLDESSIKSDKHKEYLLEKSFYIQNNYNKDFNVSLIM